MKASTHVWEMLNYQLFFPLALCRLYVCGLFLFVCFLISPSEGCNNVLTRIPYHNTNLKENRRAKGESFLCLLLLVKAISGLHV